MNANISLATDLTTAVNTGPAYETFVSQDVDASNVPAWNILTNYIVGDLVTQGGMTYRCILGNVGNVPPNATYWAVAVTTNYTAWFKYTAQAGDVVVGAMAYATVGGHTGYRPQIRVYLGPITAPIEWNPSGNSSDLDVGHNQAVQAPVTPGTTYYFQVKPDGSSTSLTELTFRMTRGPRETVTQGSLFINDDTLGFPAVYLDATDGHARKFVANITNGEHGANLPNGTYALTNDQTTEALALKVYDRNNALLGSVALTNAGGQLSVRSDGISAFYVSQHLTAAADTVVRKVSATGTLLQTWTLAGETFDVIAVDPVGILYYALSGSVAAPIKRYNLNTSSAMSDFIAGLVGFSIWFDMFVLADTNVLVVFSNAGNTDFFARLYSSTAVTIRDFAFTPPAARTDGPRSAIDHDDTFWMWSSGITSGDRLSHFEAYTISTGVQLRTFDQFVFQAGAGPAGASGNDPDVQAFGNAKSCPILVVQGTLIPEPEPQIDKSAPCPCPCDCPPDQDHPPGSGSSEPGSAGNVNPPVDASVWYRRCPGGGVPPLAADVTDPEDWYDETPPKEPDAIFTVRGPIGSPIGSPVTDRWHWGFKPLSDAGRFVQPRIIEVSPIERRSSDKDGNYPPAQVRVVAQDDDGEFRRALSDSTHEQLMHREAAFGVISRAGRKAGIDLTTLLQGRIVDVQPALNRQAVLEVQDVVGSHIGVLNPDKTIGLPIWDEHPAKPESTKGKIYPIILGEHSDAGAQDLEGNSAAVGMLPAFDCGAVWREDQDVSDGVPSTPDPDGRTFDTALGQVTDHALESQDGAGSLVVTTYGYVAPIFGTEIGTPSSQLILHEDGNGLGGPPEPHAHRHLWNGDALGADNFIVWMSTIKLFHPVDNPAADFNVRSQIVSATPTNPEIDWEFEAVFDSLTDGDQWGVQTVSQPQNLTAYRILGGSPVGSPGGSPDETNDYYYSISALTTRGETIPVAAVHVDDGPTHLSPGDAIQLEWDPPVQNPQAVIGYRIIGRDHAGLTTYLEIVGSGDSPVGTTYTDDGRASQKPFNPGTGALVSENVWAWFVCALGEVDVHQVFGSDGSEDGEPAKRSPLSWDSGVIDGPYTREVGGIRQTGFYALLGSLALKHHREGTVTFAWNGCGWADTNGLIIDQAFYMLLMVLNEAVEKNDGLGYRTGDFGPIEAFTDGVPKFWTSKFVEAQEKTIEWIGGLGYIGAIAIVEPTSISTFLRRFFTTFGGHLTTSHHGQIYPYLIDRAESSPSLGRIYRERIEIGQLLEHKYERTETENRVTYNWHYNVDQQTWKNIGEVQQDEVSIADHGGDRIGIFETGLKECFYANDLETISDRWERHLSVYAYAPRYATWEAHYKSIPDRNGDHARFMHRKEGLGEFGEGGTPGVLMHTVVTCAPYTVRQTAMLFDPVLRDDDTGLGGLEGQLIEDGGTQALVSDDGLYVLVSDGS